MTTYNPAIDCSDPSLRDALYRLYITDTANRQFGEAYRMGELVDKTGVRVLVIQTKANGAWTTIAAINASGNLYLKGTVSASQDFDALGWNPRDF